MLLVAYDFEQHEIWEEPLDTSPLSAVYSLAPAAGRFAINRIDSIESVAAPGVLPGLTPPVVTQDVRVYQTQTGNLLLKIDCNPVYRTAENFDLSADGMRLAVVRNGAIEVYHLPELTKLDRDDLAELQKFAPPPGSGRIDFQGFADAAQTAASTSAAASQAATVASGDPQTPRKPPSLLNPGEKAEFQDKNSPN